MFICNREHYGFLPMPLKSQQTLQEETENFVHMLIEAMSKLLCPAMMDTPHASPHSQYPQLMFVELSCQQPSFLPLGSLHPDLIVLMRF